MRTLFNRFLHFPITNIVVGIVASMGAMILVKVYISQPILYKLMDDKIIADAIKNCIGFIVLLTSYSLYSKYYEKRYPTELSIKYSPKEMVGGFALGFLTISLCIVVLYILGYYRIVNISTSDYSLKLFTLLLVAALIEDLLIRGLILRTLENWIGTYLGLLVVMLIEAQHVFNPNSNFISFIGDLVWGFSMASLYIFSKRIWLPFFFHLGWNFSQPFFGSNLSGLDDMGRIIHAKFEGPQLLTGGIYGIEASLISTTLLFAIGIVFFYLSIKHGKIVKAKFRSRQAA